MVSSNKEDVPHDFAEDQEADMMSFYGVVPLTGAVTAGSPTSVGTEPRGAGSVTASWRRNSVVSTWA